MESTKKWYESSGIIGGVGAAVAGAAGLLGYTITPADQQAIASSVGQIVTLVSSVGALIGGVAAIWGRVRASKKIA